jgi:folate-binding protein YgfZ
MMLNDYHAARESAALFDLSDRAKIELAGKDAREFLHNLCTQDVKSLPVGGMREAFLTTNKARVIAHIWIWHRSADVLLIDFAASQLAKVLDHLNRHLISEQVEVADRTAEFSLLRVVGPKAATLFASVGQIPTRQQPLAGFEGGDQFCPAGERDSMRERLLEAGAVPGTPATYNILRIEAGLPEFGFDIDEDRLAMEVNRPQAISYAKGCYLGQETIVMARDRGQVNRLLMGVKVASGEPLPAGAKLFRGSDEVGQVTSSVFSPRLQKVIALAYLRRGSWDAGTDVVIDPSTDGRNAVVSTLPFAMRS